MKWYVYELSDAGGVFYVGKGCGNRIETTKKQGAPEKIKRAENCEAKIIKRFAYECEAFTYEKQRIDHYGIDNLTNVSPGEIQKKVRLTLKQRRSVQDRKFERLKITVVPEDRFEDLLSMYPLDSRSKKIRRAMHETLMTMLFKTNKWAEMKTLKEREIWITLLETLADKVPRYA